MARKYTPRDKAIFKQVFVQFAWIPPAHLAAMMQVMARVEALPAKWVDFHPATASRWISEGGWRDQVEALRLVVDDDEPLPGDDQIDDRVLRRNLQVFDLLCARLAGGVGDFHHTLRHYIDLQREIRHHIQARRALPLTPEQLIEIFVQAGIYAAGQAFEIEKAKQFLAQRLLQARQVLRVEESDVQSR